MIYGCQPFMYWNDRKSEIKIKTVNINLALCILANNYANDILINYSYFLINVRLNYFYEDFLILSFKLKFDRNLKINYKCFITIIITHILYY